MSSAQATMRFGGTRHVTWLAGGALLLGLAAISVAASLLSGGGLMILLLTAPLLIAGYRVIHSRPLARVIGVLVAGCYAAAIAYVATAPSRGLAPAPGQAPTSLDLVTVGVAVCFGIAAALLLVGEPGSAE